MSKYTKSFQVNDCKIEFDYSATENIRNLEITELLEQYLDVKRDFSITSLVRLFRSVTKEYSEQSLKVSMSNDEIKQKVVYENNEFKKYKYKKRINNKLDIKYYSIYDGKKGFSLVGSEQEIRWYDYSKSASLLCDLDKTTTRLKRMRLSLAPNCYAMMQYYKSFFQKELNLETSEQEVTYMLMILSANNINLEDEIEFYKENNDFRSFRIRQLLSQFRESHYSLNDPRYIRISETQKKTTENIGEEIINYISINNISLKDFCIYLAGQNKVKKLQK